MRRVADILRSLAFYLVFYTGTLGFVTVALVLECLDPVRFARFVRNWSRFHRACARHLLGIRIAIEGTLPQGSALLAMKHESFFEAIDAPNLVPFASVVAKAELMRLPLWGRAARTYGLISVERDQGAKALRAMLTDARKLIAADRALVIFPEGTRVPHGTVAPLGSGFAGLYKMLKLPVVPLAVDSGPLYHRVWKRSGTITIRVGEAVPPGLPREEIEARVLAAINALNPPAAAQPAG